MKTPEKLAEEYANNRCGNWEECPRDNEWEEAKRGFVAGYAYAMDQWISVKDRLPGECAGLLIVYHASLKEIGTSYYDEDVWCSSPWPMTSDGITHWMLLPQPPKEEG